MGMLSEFINVTTECLFPDNIVWSCGVICRKILDIFVRIAGEVFPAFRNCWLEKPDPDFPIRAHSS